MTRLRKNQFDIKTLFFLMVAVSFTIAICQSFAGLSSELFVISLVMSGVSALVGVAMVVLSFLFAAGIAIAEKDTPQRTRNLRQCFHLFVMGAIGLGPLILLFAVAVSNWKMY